MKNKNKVNTNINKAKIFLLDYCNELKKKDLQTKIDPPMSSIHSKLVIPILYSNIITIEDVSCDEQSNYFLNVNGFLTSNVRLKSPTHYPSFTFQDSIFRVFPKTYNINKYKIINTIKQKGKILL